MKPQDKCGVFGAVSRNGFASDIGQKIYLGLFALQHRGHESAGISVSDGSVFKTHKGMGDVDAIFRPRVDKQLELRFIRQNSNMREEEFLELWEDFERVNTCNPVLKLKGVAGIGHIRYSTAGESNKENTHPILFRFHDQDAAIAHNGNLTNVGELQRILDCRSEYKFPRGMTTDTGFIAALIATSSCPTFWEAFLETLTLLEGAFSLVALHDDVVYAAKDTFGLRPLCFGKTDNFFLVASETCALSKVNAEFLGELDPGVAFAVGPDDTYPRFQQWALNPNYRSCAFEVVYFSHPASLYRGTMRLQIVRMELGKELAQKHPLREADVVASVPDSGNAAAMGYAEAVNKLCVAAIVRDHRALRSFIEPVVTKRRELRDLKYYFVPELIVGKRLVIVDDSIVRGNTMPFIVKGLRKAGAESVFVLSTFPQIHHPCHLGIDMPTREEFIANEKTNEGTIRARTVEEIKKEIGADYLGYLSVNDLREVYERMGLSADSFCYGCLTGEYPV